MAVNRARMRLRLTSLCGPIFLPVGRYWPLAEVRLVRGLSTATDPKRPLKNQTKIGREHVVSLKKYAPVPTGASDPYEPPY